MRFVTTYIMMYVVDANFNPTFFKYNNLSPLLVSSISHRNISFQITVTSVTAFWTVGYAFAYGYKGNSFIGGKYFALGDIIDEFPYNKTFTDAGIKLIQEESEVSSQFSSNFESGASKLLENKIIEE